MPMTAELSDLTDPSKPLENWSSTDAIQEMEAALQDAGGFLTNMQRAEDARVCWWEGKDFTGRKNAVNAKPWKGCADHEVHLIQEIVNQRNASRMVALAGGAISVEPTEATDARSAAVMKSVMRYYMRGPMRSSMLKAGLRAGAWADRFGHSILYVGWKEERGLEPITVTLDELTQKLIELSPAATTNELGEPQVVDSSTWNNYQLALLDPGAELQVAETLIAAYPGLQARGNEGLRQMRRALKELRSEPSAKLYASYVKKSCPEWEALVPFVDVFYPAETQLEEGLNSCRWIGRAKWMSAQQLREQAAIHGWNASWVDEVLKNKKGKTNAFDSAIGTKGWVLSGAGVRWTSLTSTGRVFDSETTRHLYQIVELWDRSATQDGLIGTYHTVMHADVPDMVAKRELREDWHGQYPFIAFTHEVDEKYLLASRGVADFAATAQHAIKAQHDSRTNAASLTTMPPMMGPPELRDKRLAPDTYLETHRIGSIQAFTLPPPDSRSIEIENTLRAGINRFFGLPSKDVPTSVSMLMQQSHMNWFLHSISQAVARSAQLIQQYMSPLKRARISGTMDEVTATAEEVRGNYDFSVAFDMRSTDIEWAKEVLGFANEFILPMDNRGDVIRRPLLEFAFNMLSPTLAEQSLPESDQASRVQLDEERAAITEIFSGGAPPVQEGIDYAARAQLMVDELQRSPDRQQQLMTNPQKRLVFTERLKQLVANSKQYGENAQIGRTLGEDPLKQPTPAESMLEQLEQLGDAEPQPTPTNE